MNMEPWDNLETQLLQCSAELIVVSCQKGTCNRQHRYNGKLVEERDLTLVLNLLVRKKVMIFVNKYFIPCNKETNKALKRKDTVQMGRDLI